MASLTRKTNGSCTIAFTDPDGKPRWLYPGVMPRKAAESILRHVEAILAAKVSGSPLPVDTARWLAGAGDTLYGRLAAAGLVAPRVIKVKPRLGELLDAYVARRTDLRPRSLLNLDRAVKSLNGHFGADRDCTTITPAEVEDWQRARAAKFAPATVGNETRRAQQIFSDAVRRGLLPESPFAGLKAPAQVNSARLQYVPAATVEAVMAACPDDEWRLAFALARYGGLRTPSESQALKWGDVDWVRQRITVTSTKLERHAGKGRRTIPLFRELYAPLLKCYEAATDKSGYVLPTLRGGNLATRADRIIRRAGFPLWERTFQNLRASRETDLARLYPIQVVCAWIGNSPAVALAHYLSVTDEDYRNAAGLEAGAAIGAAPVDAVSKGFGERPANIGAKTAEQGPKIGALDSCEAFYAGTFPAANLTFPTPALNFALSAFPPETSAVALHRFAEQIYARAAAGRVA